MKGIASQIGHYMNHVGARNVASKATPAAMSKAQSVAMGQRGAGSLIRRPIHPGSPAGWKHSKAAVIAPAESGYFNPRYHKARYGDHRIKIPAFASMSPNSVKYNNKTFDMRKFNSTHS